MLHLYERLSVRDRGCRCAPGAALPAQPAPLAAARAAIDGGERTKYICARNKSFGKGLQFYRAMARPRPFFTSPKDGAEAALPRIVYFRMELAPVIGRMSSLSAHALLSARALASAPPVLHAPTIIKRKMLARPPQQAPAKRARRPSITRIISAARKRGDLVVIAPDGTVTINNAPAVEVSGNGHVNDLDRELEEFERRHNGKA